MKNSKDNFFLIFLCLSLLLIIFSSFLIDKGNILGIKDGDVQMILVGDVMLGRSVMTRSLRAKDYSFPFLKVKSILNDADIVLGNLENSFVTNCPATNTGMILCAGPKMISGLVSSNIDIVNIANNHIGNYGEKGREETKEVLLRNDIEYVGDDNLVIKKMRGAKFGFLGFDFVSKNPKPSDYELIADLDKKVDVLIIAVHWGGEYQAKANKYQREWGRKMIESGADVIAGHHPHWVQDIEYIDGKPVYYSLGNFVFDQLWSEQTRKGLVIRLTFNKAKIIKEEKLPIYINSSYQPEFSN